MADFKTSFELTVINEGFYSNDSGDSGGETIWGLTRNTDSDWSGWHFVDQYKANPGYPGNFKAISNNLKILSEPYYKIKYWLPMRGDEIASQEEASKIYDQFVNFGVSEGITIAQRALGILETGKMDDRTLKYLNGTNV